MTDTGTHRQARLRRPGGALLAMSDKSLIQWTDETVAIGRVGKKRAGRLLDGITHDGFPEVQGC